MIFRITLLLLAICLCQTTAHTQNRPSTPLTIGSTHTFHSKALGEDRTIHVYLPEGYDSTQSYPVLYLLDGSKNEDLLHIVGLVQFFNMQFNMPPCLVVGVANVDRKRDFTFHTDMEELTKAYPTTGHSDRFIQFLETELRHYVDQRYRTKDTRYLIGQSLGGLVATEILLKKPQLFSHYLIVSPSLWWDDESLLKAAPELLKKHEKAIPYVYIAVGQKEPKVMRRDAKKLYALLKKQPLIGRVDFNKMGDEDHASILHNAIYAAFLKLLPPATK
jgi:predicted alpha/beta superfamily hydrolase